MNNIQELRKIIESAKENQNEVYILDGVPYYTTTRKNPNRSLADIRTIVEQADRIADMQNQLDANARLLEFYVNEYQAKGGDV